MVSSGSSHIVSKTRQGVGWPLTWEYFVFCAFVIVSITFRSSWNFDSLMKEQRRVKQAVPCSTRKVHTHIIVVHGTTLSEGACWRLIFKSLAVNTYIGSTCEGSVGLNLWWRHAHSLRFATACKNRHMQTKLYTNYIYGTSGDMLYHKNNIFNQPTKWKKCPCQFPLIVPYTSRLKKETANKERRRPEPHRCKPVR